MPSEDPNIEYLDLKIDSLDALFDVDVADFMDQLMMIVKYQDV